MRVIFMGTPDFSVPALKELIRVHDVAAVVTQPDKRKGRGKAMACSPVKQTAMEAGIPVLQPVRVREESFVETLKEYEPDVIVVAAFGQILPETILRLPPYGCINIHASLLPRYRGAAPIQWAIIDGEKETGITIMYMEKGLDTGDMIARAVIPIDEKETGESLHDKLSLLGGPLILEVLDSLEKGTVRRTKQNDEESCYAPMLTKELGCVDWNTSAVSIERLIRGLNSWPSAYTRLGDRTLKLWEAQVLDETDHEKKAPAGTVVDVDKDSFTVQCGQGQLRIDSVQLQGKRRMSVHDFLLGRSLETGTRLG